MPELDEAIIKRIMPHDNETEMSLLGAIIMDNDKMSVAREYISAEDFYNRLYGATFQAMIELFEGRKPIDPITLHNKLSDMDVPPEATTMEYIGTLANSVATAANARSYAESIAEKSTLRKLIRLNEDIATQCYSGKKDIEEILHDTEKRTFELLQRRNSGEFVSIRQIVTNAMDMIEAASKNKGSVTGIPTGFTDLDSKTMGMQPSDLVLVAARPSMGKTAFVLNIAQNVAFKQNKSLVIFSLEMSKESLVNRMLAMESRVDAQDIRSGQLSDAQWHDLIEAAGTIGRSNLIIDETPGISVNEMRSKCLKFKLEFDIQMIIIDYIQLMSGSGSKASEASRQQQVSEISRSLKALARELHVPVIALSQLSRAVEQRTDHRPMLSDLRESGAIEQDADVCMFLYRDEYYNPDSEKRGTAEVIIAKQRNGPIGTVELAWLPQFTKFANLAHDDRYKKDE